MEASGQLHAPAALPPGKEPPVPIRQEVERIQEPTFTWLWREKIPAPVVTDYFLT